MTLEVNISLTLSSLSVLEITDTCLFFRLVCKVLVQILNDLRHGLRFLQSLA